MTDTEKAEAIRRERNDAIAVATLDWIGHFGLNIVTDGTHYFVSETWGKPWLRDSDRRKWESREEAYRSAFRTIHETGRREVKEQLP
jgi:hypothetical protein